MKEQLYTIPVNDAYHTDCECPICKMHESLEQNAIEFTIGPSYMEDDVRMETDKMGFCNHHIQLLYESQNRLGLALMLKTHMDKTISDLEKLASDSSSPSFSIFKKKEASPIASYVNRLETSCFVCNRIHTVLERYLITVFFLYRTEEEFRKTFRNSKGVCTKHYEILRCLASSELKGNLLTDFISDLDQVYIINMKRVRDDLEWFIDKFDYRNADAPWKNSKDALPRAITKTNSIL